MTWTSLGWRKVRLTPFFTFLKSTGLIGMESLFISPHALIGTMMWSSNSHRWDAHIFAIAPARIGKIKKFIPVLAAP